MSSSLINLLSLLGQYWVKQTNKHNGRRAPNWKVQSAATKIGLGLLADPKHLIASITSIDLIEPLGSASNSTWKEPDVIYCRRRGGTMVKWAHHTSQIDQCPTVSKKLDATDSNFCFSTWSEKSYSNHGSYWPRVFTGPGWEKESRATFPIISITPVILMVVLGIPKGEPSTKRKSKVEC
jgi:hypothetical protein